jgi:MoaA/NifB/PqqE/SkfB family radical SAM enzyme
MPHYPPIAARNEKWGRLVYDSVTDEFEAHLSSDSADAVISQPISAGCIVTGECNLRCEFCYGDYESLPHDEISAKDWERIFVNLRSLGLMRVDLSGGEPTLRPDLPEIVQAATGAGLNVVISTNGRTLGIDRLDRFPRSRWHVSLDSGIADIHERSRLLSTFEPSTGGFKRTLDFMQSCVERGLPVRALTPVAWHNRDELFALGEQLALIGVTEWNISRILSAGRAKADYSQRWTVNEDYILEQVHDMRVAFSSVIRIRYSNRTDQDGYFLLVLPDGSLATQRSGACDKVVLGAAAHLSLSALESSSDFSIVEHGRKWIAASLISQTFHPALDPPLWIDCLNDTGISLA